MNRLAVLIIALALIPVTAAAQIAPETRWADPTHVVLDVEFPGDGYRANWEMFRCKCGDLLVRSELNIPGEAEKGETLMVARRAVLTRGFGDYQAEMAGSLDAPALMMQTALRLLERAEPGGPSRVQDEIQVNVSEELMNIMLDTGTAAGGYQAPWTVTGTIAPAGETRRDFDLDFRFTVRDDSGELMVGMKLKGVTDFEKTEFVLTGDEPLEGWLLTWRDEADPLATAARSVRTLGELRSLINGN